MALCSASDSCVAISFDFDDRRCELWSKEPRFTEEDEESSAVCMKRGTGVVATSTTTTISTTTLGVPVVARPIPSLPTLSPGVSAPVEESERGNEAKGKGKGEGQEGDFHHNLGTQDMQVAPKEDGNRNLDKSGNVDRDDDKKPKTVLWIILGLVLLFISACAGTVFWQRRTAAGNASNGEDDAKNDGGQAFIEGPRDDQPSNADGDYPPPPELRNSGSGSSKVRRWSPEGRTSRDATEQTLGGNAALQGVPNAIREHSTTSGNSKVRRWSPPGRALRDTSEVFDGSHHD
jgi:hypothetical protein